MISHHDHASSIGTAISSSFGTFISFTRPRRGLACASMSLSWFRYTSAAYNLVDPSEKHNILYITRFLLIHVFSSCVQRDMTQFFFRNRPSFCGFNLQLHHPNQVSYLTFLKEAPLQHYCRKYPHRMKHRCNSHVSFCKWCIWI